MSNCVAHPYGELYIILLAQKRKKRAIYCQNKEVKTKKICRKVDALFPIIHYYSKNSMQVEFTKTRSKDTKI